MQEDALLKMSGALSHRGPDDTGVWVSHDRSVGLAHRRLSIIDLSVQGRQPMANEDGSIQLVYNGEIYNFRELREDLVSKGHIFRSGTDSEAVVHAYEQWGSSCLERLNGIFAFALWDARTESLFAARDRLGVKPFYYWRGPAGDFAFASELKALMEVPELSKEVDSESLWWYLRLRRVPAPRSILKGCAQLQPGHFLVWRPGTRSLTVGAYWSAASFASEKRARPIEEVEETVLQALDRAVRQQLISDVPMGAFLSGGMDSTLVAGLMAQAGGRVRTFSIGFEDQFNEAPYARRIAGILGADHEEMYVRAADMKQVIPDLPTIYDEPLADSSAIPTVHLARMTRRYVTVALSGDGGDELFGGYGWYRLVKRLRRLALIPEALRHTAVRAGRALPWGKVQKGMNLLDFQGLPDLMWNVTGCWQPEEIRRLLPDVSQPHSHVRSNGALHGPYLNRLLLHDLTTYLPDEILVKVDRASMSVGLEVRVPLLDHEVVETMLRLPPSLKIAGDSHKVIVHRILKRWVPKDLLDRPNHGFGPPLTQWLREDLSWMIDEYLRPNRIRRAGYLDDKTVQDAVRHFRQGRSSHYRVWALIVLQMWAERYGIW